MLNRFHNGVEDDDDDGIAIFYDLMFSTNNPAMLTRNVESRRAAEDIIIWQCRRCPSPSYHPG